MSGPPEYLESYQPNVAALNVYNFASGGPLIYGYNPQRNMVFQVFNDGTITTQSELVVRRNITTAGSILASGDVYARGVMLTSDKNAKENFSDVSTLQILDKLASMPIHSWNYKDDTPSERHIGPTAQDFHATFGLNGDDNNKHISSVDLQGVALAAIQGLNEKLKAENAELYKNLAKLEARLLTLESKR
ncbi:tail fiber domain-containing protein [Bacillus cereus]